MIKQGFESNLKSKICQGKLSSNYSLFYNFHIMAVHSHIYIVRIEFRCFALLFWPLDVQANLYPPQKCVVSTIIIWKKFLGNLGSHTFVKNIQKESWSMSLLLHCLGTNTPLSWNIYTLECFIGFLEHTALCKFEKRLLRTFAFYLCEPRLPRNFFHIIIVQTTHFCTVLVLVLYRTYQDAF